MTLYFRYIAIFDLFEATEPQGYVHVYIIIYIHVCIHCVYCNSYQERSGKYWIWWVCHGISHNLSPWNVVNIMIIPWNWSYPIFRTNAHCAILTDIWPDKMEEMRENQRKVRVLIREIGSTRNQIKNKVEIWTESTNKKLESIDIFFRVFLKWWHPQIINSSTIFPSKNHPFWVPLFMESPIFWCLYHIILVCWWVIPYYPFNFPFILAIF